MCAYTTKILLADRRLYDVVSANWEYGIIIL